MCRPWLKCYPTQTTQMLKVQTYRNTQIDTDVLRSSTLFALRGWQRWESIKGNAAWWGGRLLSLVFILTQRKVKKAACDRREDWCAKTPHSPALSPSLFLLPIRRSGIPQSEQRLILSPPRDRACCSHIGWDETFREGLLGSSIVQGQWDWYWWRWQDGDVGIGRTDWTWERCEQVRQRWKSRLSPWDRRDWPAVSFQTPWAQRPPLGPVGVTSGQVVLRRIDPLSPNADWY